MDLYRDTLEKYLRTQSLSEQEEISWNHFQALYKGLADLGFTALLTTEDTDQAHVWSTVAQTLTDTGHLGIALAFLWQAGINRLVLEELVDGSDRVKALSEGLVQGNTYINFPWPTENEEEYVYPLSFGETAEKYLILEPDGKGKRVMIASLADGFSGYTKRFAWAGMQEVRLHKDDQAWTEREFLGHLTPQGLKAIENLENFFILACSIELAHKAWEGGFRYTQTRTQFGRKIWDFQVLQHSLAEAYSKYQVLNAAFQELTEYFSRTQRISEGSEVIKGVALAYLREIADKALQVHGGNGYMREYPAQRYWRDAMLLSLYD